MNKSFIFHLYSISSCSPLAQIKGCNPMDATLKCDMLSCATADVVNGLGLVPLKDNLATLT